MIKFIETKGLPLFLAATSFALFVLLCIAITGVAHDLIKDWNCPACADKCEARK